MPAPKVEMIALIEISPQCLYKGSHGLGFEFGSIIKRFVTNLFKRRDLQDNAELAFTRNSRHFHRTVSLHGKYCRVHHPHTQYKYIAKNRMHDIVSFAGIKGQTPFSASGLSRRTGKILRIYQYYSENLNQTKTAWENLLNSRRDR